MSHHGSKTSSRATFLSKVGAQFFVISAGPTKYASVTLPDQEIVDEVEGLGMLFRTDLEDDDGCAESTAKVGPDNDGKPGGCDNVLIQIPLSGPVSAQAPPHASHAAFGAPACGPTDCADQGLEYAQYRMWGSAEYLLWRLQGAPDGLRPR